MTDATLFVGGRIFTGRRYCAALLVEDGEVLVAGSEAEARRGAGTGTDVLALNGDLLLPGLIDAHLHVAEVARLRDGLSVAAVRDREALAAAIRDWAASHPSGPILARRWSADRGPGGPWPTRADLDGILPDRPLALVHESGHVWVVNSAMLAAAGIPEGIVDPPGGRFGRGSDGTLDGRVFESALATLEARSSMREPVGPDALARTLREATDLGITTVGAMNVAPDEAVGLRQLAVERRLPARVRLYLRAGGAEAYFDDPGGPSGAPGWFEVAGIKAFADGAFGPRTAWLAAPYADAPAGSGMPAATEEELRAVLATARARHLVPAVHAIGDRAIARVCALFAERPLPFGRLPRIEHAALTPPELWPALAEVRPALVVQPGFVWSDAWLPGRLGPARCRWAYAFRSLIARGHLLAGSSDAPYDPIDPWRGLRAATERTGPDGSANPEPSEALEPEEAVRLYTANAGPALGEPRLGALEPGAPADLVRVHAPTIAAAIAAGAPSVRGTWVAGARVASDAPASEPHKG